MKVNNASLPDDCRFTSLLAGIPCLSQADSRWSDIKIGSSRVTIGSDGCLITCISMLSAFYGCFQMPDRIAADSTLFDCDGFLLWLNLDFPGFSFRWREGSMTSTAPARNDAFIKAYLPDPDNRDRTVLLAVTNNSHWVLPIRHDDSGNDYWAIDPRNGSIIKVLETYQSICGSAHFTIMNNRSGKAWQGKGKPLPPDFD